MFEYLRGFFRGRERMTIYVNSLVPTPSRFHFEVMTEKGRFVAYTSGSKIAVEMQSGGVRAAEALKDAQEAADIALNILDTLAKGLHDLY